MLPGGHRDGYARAPALVPELVASELAQAMLEAKQRRTQRCTLHRLKNRLDLRKAELEFFLRAFEYEVECPGEVMRGDHPRCLLARVCLAKPADEQGDISEAERVGLCAHEDEEIVCHGR